VALVSTSIFNWILQDGACGLSICFHRLKSSLLLCYKRLISCVAIVDAIVIKVAVNLPACLLVWKQRLIAMILTWASTATCMAVIVVETQYSLHPTIQDLFVKHSKSKEKLIEQHRHLDQS
jgi:hypothetical protein